MNTDTTRPHSECTMHHPPLTVCTANKDACHRAGFIHLVATSSPSYCCVRDPTPPAVHLRQHRPHLPPPASSRLFAPLRQSTHPVTLRFFVILSLLPISRVSCTPTCRSLAFLLWHLVCSITSHSTYNPGISQQPLAGFLDVLLSNLLGLLILVTILCGVSRRVGLCLKLV
jgi:hypothetical protein